MNSKTIQSENKSKIVKSKIVKSKISKMIAQIDPKTKEARYFSIRKLTPRECGRLMGVPEGHLAV